MSPGNQYEDVPPSPRNFRTTLWSTIIEARDQHSTVAAKALEDLCLSYWPPIYSFLRRRGFSSHDAEDLTQGFFVQMLEGQFLQNVLPEKGRFRSFLLKSLNNFVTNQWERTQTLKRGGHQTFISFDASPELRQKLEPSHSHTPEQAFEYRWAITLLEHALCKLEQEQTAADELQIFHALQPMIPATLPGAYAQTAATLGITENSARVKLHRLRSRLAQLIRDEIALTVEHPNEIDGEVQYLRSLLGSV